MEQTMQSISQGYNCGRMQNLETVSGKQNSLYKVNIISKDVSKICSGMNSAWHHSLGLVSQYVDVLLLSLYLCCLLQWGPDRWIRLPMYYFWWHKKLQSQTNWIVQIGVPCKCDTGLWKYLLRAYDAHSSLKEGNNVVTSIEVLKIRLKMYLPVHLAQCSCHKV